MRLVLLRFLRSCSRPRRRSSAESTRGAADATGLAPGTGRRWGPCLKGARPLGAADATGRKPLVTGVGRISSTTGLAVASGTATGRSGPSADTVGAIASLGASISAAASSPASCDSSAVPNKAAARSSIEGLASDGSIRGWAGAIVAAISSACFASSAAFSSALASTSAAVRRRRFGRASVDFSATAGFARVAFFFVARRLRVVVAGSARWRFSRSQRARTKATCSPSSADR